MRPPWLRGSMKLEERAAPLIQWPSTQYAGRAPDFCRDILGFEPWEHPDPEVGDQVKILQALEQPNARVAVRSCNGVGKTHIGGSAALYWFSLYPDGQVILSAPVLRQVEDLMWRAIRALHQGSGVCVKCRRDKFPGRQCEHSTRLDGDCKRTPEAGLVVDMRVVKGFVAISAKTAVGYFGLHQLWIGDEAAGLRNDWLEAAQAACKAQGEGAHLAILAIGNPSELTGFHADAFLKTPPPGEASYWTHRYTISALNSPNVRLGRTVVPGLVTREWVEGCRLLWGEQSDLYKIRVLGVHPEHVRGMLVSFGEIELMHARWQPNEKPPTEDGLWIGLDVAAFDRSVLGYTVKGSSGIAGDKWVMVAVRGDYVCEFQKWPTMTRDELVLRLRDLVRKWQAYPRERVTVRYDCEGNEGEECRKVLEREQGNSESELSEWQIDGVKVSMRIPDPSQSATARVAYGTVRDAGYANLAEWIRKDGSCPPDNELDDELVHTVWIDDPRGGKERIAEKKDIKDKLPHHRSPDTIEALMIAVWTGRVISHTDREVEDDPTYQPNWMRGSEKVPRDRRDPGVRGAKRRMI